MFAGNHTGGSAAGESGLDRIGIGNHFVAFEELDREKRNLLNGFDVLDIGVEEVAEVFVYGIVFVLETKDF